MAEHLSWEWQKCLNSECTLDSFRILGLFFGGKCKLCNWRFLGTLGMYECTRNFHAPTQLHAVLQEDIQVLPRKDTGGCRAMARHSSQRFLSAHLKWGIEGFDPNNDKSTTPEMIGHVVFWSYFKTAQNPLPPKWQGCCIETDSAVDSCWFRRNNAIGGRG